MTGSADTDVAAELRALREEIADLREALGGLDRKLDDLAVQLTLMSGELHEVEEGVEYLEERGS